MVAPRRNKKGLFLFTSCILMVTVLGTLASCIGRAPSPSPSAPPMETQSPTRSPSPTPELTPTPAPTPALTPIPAPLPMPALTLTSTPIPNLTALPTPAPTMTSPPDTTPPSAITGLIAVNAYDGRVNLWWDKSAAQDFDHYNVYVSELEADVTGAAAIQQIKDILATNYQATGLKNGTKYYFALTAVDKNGNENRRVTSLNVIPLPIPRGTVDSDLQVDVYQSDMVWAGTTLFADNHNIERPRILEVNMLGEIVWQYLVPYNLKQYTNPGFDVELLPNNNILFVLPRYGIYEIDRKGNIVWSYLTGKVSHDADRLPNGNTIFVFGADDQKGDAQVMEINPKGEIVWSWRASDYFDKPPYKDIFDEGWTHTNSVSRLPNGNTLISPRNFNFLVEVDARGSVVRTIGEGVLRAQHDPEVLQNGNILVANHGLPHRAVEIDLKTGRIVWQSPGFERDATPVRDANRLSNGNTLITGSTKIVELTSSGKIVWQLSIKGATFGGTQQGPGLGFYKAERIGVQR